MMRLQLTFLLLYALFLSCNSKLDKRRTFYNEQGLLTKRLYYPDSSTIMLERTYKQDSIPEGYARSFYPSGAEELYIEYADGKKHGYEIAHYNNKAVRNSGRNKYGLQDSVWIWYDSLGRIENRDYWIKGVLSGEQVHYYTNGKIQTCLFYNPLGELVYKATFDEAGAKKVEEGNKLPILSIKSLHSIYKWRQGEIFFAKVFLCCCETNEPSFIELREAGKGELLDSIQIKPQESIFNYTTTLSRVGEFDLNIIQNKKEGLITSTHFIVESN